MRKIIKFNRGLIIGKFYPPHKGHKYLIDYACSRVKKLTVIVCENETYKIPGELRFDWLKKIHPNVEFILYRYNLKDLSDDDTEGWAKVTKKIINFKPDIVFSSEEYGYRWAELLGSRHILVDIERKNISISGSAIRKDPYKYWNFLEAPVKHYFLKRVCVLGAESTGTTTLAKSLAEVYHTQWVPEYGREYCEKVLGVKLFEHKWREEEFLHIARQQNILEEKYSKSANKILICDTNSFATTVWCERYTGKWSKKVEKISDGRKYDLYILTKDDIPFVQDGTRDGRRIRHSMHLTFLKLLKERKEKYIIVSGNHKKRLKTSIDFINNNLFKQ